MFIGIENHPACFAMLSEGCKRSIMAGTIFRFNTVSPLPRLRIIRITRSQIISKRDQSRYILFYNPFIQNLYIKWLFKSKSSFVLPSYSVTRYIFSSWWPEDRCVWWNVKYCPCPVPYQYNGRHKLSENISSKEKEKILFVTKQPLHTPPPSHWTESAK